MHTSDCPGLPFRALFGASIRNIMSAPHILIHPLGRHGTRQQIIACVLFALTGPVLALDYWQNGGSITFVGAIPLPILFIVACLGGAVSFALFVGRRWWLAIIPGIL